MASAFGNILIPVDFTINTELAIRKAADLAVAGSTTVHLLHVTREADNKQAEDSAASVAEKQLDVWKVKLETMLPGVTVKCWLAEGGNIHRSIIAKARRIAPDMIIIGRSSYHNWLPFLNTLDPDDLAARTGSVVLTVKPGSMHNTIRAIVVPVTDKMPQQKLEVLSTLCKRMRLKVYLVGFTKADGDPQNASDTLLRIYQWLKTVLHCSVEYAFLHGANKPKALLAYAARVGADTLLVHPETETRIGWPNRHIADLLPASSKMQVLTVQPSLESFT